MDPTASSVGFPLSENHHSGENPQPGNYISSSNGTSTALVNGGSISNGLPVAYPPPIPPIAVTVTISLEPSSSPGSPLSESTHDHEDPLPISNGPTTIVDNGGEMSNGLPVTYPSSMPPILDAVTIAFEPSSVAGIPHSENTHSHEDPLPPSNGPTTFVVNGGEMNNVLPTTYPPSMPSILGSVTIVFQPSSVAGLPHSENTHSLEDPLPLSNGSTTIVINGGEMNNGLPVTYTSSMPPISEAATISFEPSSVVGLPHSENTHSHEDPLLLSNGPMTIGGGEEDEPLDWDDDASLVFFMMEGLCKDPYVNWYECRQEAIANGEIPLAKCHELAIMLRDCVLANPNYYEPVYEHYLDWISP